MDARSRELVVLSWGGAWGRALAAAVSGPFTARTGVAVRHLWHVGLRLPPGLMTALAARRRPPVDVVWCNAVPALRAAQGGLCAPLSEDEVPSLGALHERARIGAAGDGRWLVAMAYVVHYVLVYRVAAFTRAPESWAALADARCRGKVALYPGGNGLYPVAQVLGGGALDDIPEDMAPCWSFLARLRGQAGALAYSIGMEEALRRGSLDLCFRALPNALGFRGQGLDVGWTAPVEGVPDTMDALWVPRGLDVDPEAGRWARRYIDFALSREVQARWCALLGALPMRPDAPPPEVMASPRMPRSLDDPDRVLWVPDRVVVAHQDVWERRFDEVVGGAAP